MAWCLIKYRDKFTYQPTMIGSFGRSQSQLLYDWQFTANQFALATSPLRLTSSNYIFQLNICSYSPYVTSSLTRGWVCRLQLLLALASVVSGPSPAGIMITFYCLRVETPPTWRTKSTIYISKEQSGPVIPPGTGFPFHRPLRLAGLRWILSWEEP
jgi:hypothetical protein